MSSKHPNLHAQSRGKIDFARQISEYMARVSDLRARQALVQDSGYFNQLYEEVSQGIEELRIAEEELRQRDGEIYNAYAAVVRERRRYKAVFELGPEAHLITDGDGVVLEANHRAVTLFNMPAVHLHGKPVAFFVCGSEQRKLFREWFRDVSRGRIEGITLALQRQDREPFAAELAATRVTGDTPDSGLLMWTIADVSYKLVNQRDAELAAVAEVTGDAIVVLSHAGAVIAQNPASHRLHGDLVGRSFREAITIESFAQHQRTIEALSAAAPVATIDSAHARSDGTPVDVSVTYSLVAEPAGSRPRFALVIRDISDKKQLESELRERALEREHADRKKTEFIGLLAHELRSPLNVIVTAMQALARTNDPLLRDRALDTSLRNARDMTRLIDELLDLSRISRDELAIEPRPVSIQDVVKRASELAGPAIEQRHHDLKLELPEQPVVICADFSRLSQAIANLLDNAAKYTPPGGKIGVSVHSDERWIKVRVQDNGIGIPPELIDRVFEQFVQDRSNRSASGGLGIGLALVRRIVELHGGSVTAESAGPGSGAEFTLALPMGAGERTTAE
jgi:two-component system CheB/CheR fusion protein